MHSPSSESSLQDQLIPPQLNPPRAKFTLLADLNELNHEEESPVRTYLRQLHEKRSFSQKGSEKENSNCSNKNEAERDVWNEEVQDRKMGLKMACDSGNAFKKVVERAKQLKEPKENRKPGMHLYRKVINLNEPAQRWQNLSTLWSKSSTATSPIYDPHTPIPRGSHPQKLFESALRSKFHKM